MDLASRLLLAAIASSVASSQREGRIILPDQVRFSCSVAKPDRSLLKCTCNTDDRALSVSIFPGASLAWSTIRRYSGRIAKVELSRCSPSIGKRAFSNLGLTRLTIKEAKHLSIQPEGFWFAGSRNVAVVIDGVQEPVAIPTGIFGPTVTSVSIRGVKLVRFSSLSLAGINPNADVTISNASVYPSKDHDLELPTVTVQRLEFVDVKFDFVGSSFLRLSAAGLHFRRVKLDLLAEGSVVVDVADLSFDECDIGFLRAETFHVLANRAAITNSRMREPHQKALMGFAGANSTSKLTIANVTFEDPARGTLLTLFADVEFRNLTVDRCKCGLASDLVEEQTAFRGLLPTLSQEELLRRLSNETFCLPNGRGPRKRPEDCVDSGNDLVVAALTVSLFVTVTCVVGAVYGWHKKIKKGYGSTRRSWALVVPTVSYKESSVVQFDEEVQYISRPNSTVFAIDGNYAYALTSSANWRPKSIYCRPDRASTIDDCGDEEEEHIYAEVDNITR